MNDQENQETQGSGQVLAEVQQEAPATSETTAVDQNVQTGEDSAPEVQAASQPEEAPQGGEAPAEEAPAPQADAAPATEPAAAPAAQGSQDFGQILAEFEQQSAPKKEKEPRESKGPQKVSGKILSIGDEWIFVDLGGKAEGRIAAAELKDAEGNLTVKEGDSIDATVTGTDPESGALLLQRRAGGKGKGKKPAEVVPEIRQAAEHSLPLEGLVTGLNKGGAEVQVYGMRAFCPLSQLDLRYVENPQQFVGQKLMFKVNRLEEGNRGGRGPNIVLSRRQLLEEEQQARASETREKLQVGAVLHGRVTSLTSYGAFIDLGGIEGMLHVSEIGHSRTTHPQDVFTVGQEVEVQVIKIEKGKEEKRPERISLSRRSLQSDPWNEAASRFTEGMEVPGRVMRTETFGAFVELAPGLEGLVHISEMGAGRRLNHSREAVQPGQEVQVRVLGVDTARRRISLSMNTGAAATAGSGMSGGYSGGAGSDEPRGERRRGGGGGGRHQDFARSERGDRSRGDRGGSRGGDDDYARSGGGGAAVPSNSSGSGFGSMADFFERAKKG
ncbi:MAG TPA: S1 RNA-binding domain-containing protein [Thermoanaerobaculia bacterium]|jgi:small subunit ribosomal protein S1